MKKHLLVAVLILAVITSLTAGTLASYNKTLEPFNSADIRSKKFIFDGCADELWRTGLKIVPGDKMIYTVTVKQDTETPMAYTGTAQITGKTGETLAGLLTTKVSYTNPVPIRTMEEELDSVALDKSSGGQGGNVSVFAGKYAFTYTITVEWDKGDDVAQVAASNQTVNLSFSINGKSTEQPQTYDKDHTKDV